MLYQNYGSVKKIPFVLELNGQLATPTLVTGDVKLIKDGASPVNVINLPVAVGTSGDFEWTPTVAETQAGHYFTLVLIDQSATKTFDNNRVVHYTGGNTSARINPTNP